MPCVRRLRPRRTRSCPTLRQRRRRSWPRLRPRRNARGCVNRRQGHGRARKRSWPMVLPRRTGSWPMLRPRRTRSWPRPRPRPVLSPLPLHALGALLVTHGDQGVLVRDADLGVGAAAAAAAGAVLVGLVARVARQGGVPAPALLRQAAGPEGFWVRERRAGERAAGSAGGGEGRKRFSRRRFFTKNRRK